MVSSGSAEVDGARLAWNRSNPKGRDVSVLLAHGITDSAACWEPIAAKLSESYDVIRYDARGHGTSDRAASYSFELHVNDLIGLARALRLDRPVLFGHSMDGAHAAVAAAELDARALILEDPHWPKTPEDDTSHDVAAGRQSLAEFAELPDAELEARCRNDHPTWADADIESWVRAQRQLDPNVVSWFESWPTINQWRDHVAKLRCPGLLLAGDRSPTVTAEAAAEAMWLWPQLQAVQIPGAGHNVRRDQFEQSWLAIAAFLERLRGIER